MRKIFSEMNRHFFYVILMAALLAAVITSCNREDEEVPTGQIAVNLRADIQSANTNPGPTLRVANNQWEPNDEVGLYMKRAGQAITTHGAIYGGGWNVRMSIMGQSLISTPVMYPTSGNVDFVAYYPFNLNVYYDLTIPVNVAEQEAGLPNEILYSNNITNQAPTEDPVTLNFNYSLAKIELTVTGGANSKLTATDYAAAAVTVEEVYTQAKFQLADGTFTDFQEKQPVTLHRKSNNATSATFEALMLPTNEEITLLFEVGGAVYRYTIPANTNFASAMLYRYNFTLDVNGFQPQTLVLLNAVILSRTEAPEQDISIDASKRMTMTTVASEVTLCIGGTGQVSIDWGDGTPIETYGGDGYTTFNYSYSSTSTRTITITGENITSLICRGNQLTSIDVSKNTVLTELTCSNNLLESIDVSKNTALTSLECSYNILESLDVSKNTALIQLECSYNLLESLDMSKNTSLTYLGCRGNKLKSIDVSNNTALIYLSLGRNLLESIDVSKNTALRSLECGGNKLESIDVSKNTALTSLECSYNLLESLDVSKNTALADLLCWNNLLRSLYVNENTALIRLLCEDNLLESLELSKNTALINLNCGNNQLNILDVSNNIALKGLNCSGNQLTSLILNKNTKLEALDCSWNQLPELDVSENTELTVLHCSSNILQTEGLNTLFYSLHNNNLVYKNIYISGNPGTATCNRSIAENKGWAVF